MPSAEQKEMAQKLLKGYQQLPAKDHSFASDLGTKGMKYDWSEKQLFWVNKLLSQIKTGRKVKIAHPAQFAEKTFNKEVAEIVMPKGAHGEFVKVVNLFENAKAKTPADHHSKLRIVIRMVTGNLIQLSMGIKGKNKGYVWLHTADSDASKAFQINLGRISPAGTYQPPWPVPAKADIEYIEAVVEILRWIAAEPERALAQTGWDGGFCPLCAQEYDPINLSGGKLAYHSDCGPKWGLTWDGPKLQCN